MLGKFFKSRPLSAVGLQIDTKITKTMSDDTESDAESVASQQTDSDMSDLQVEFVFNAPRDQDFYAIKNLLAQLFGADALTHNLNLSALADEIIKQGIEGFGTCVRCENEADPDVMLDPNALTTLLPMPVKVLQMLTIKFPAEPASSSSKKSRTDSQRNFKVAHAENAALLVHERLLNMPSECAGPLCSIVRREWLEKCDGAFKNVKYIVYVTKKFHPTAYTST